jgi:tight adherence protein C
MNQTVMILVCAFASIGALTYWISTLLLGDEQQGKLRSRLQGRGKTSIEKKTSMTPLLQQLGQAASKPFMPSSREKVSKMQSELRKAGIYATSALRTIQGAKFIGISVGVIVGYVVSLFLGNLLAFVSIAGLVGYMSPTLWLRMRVKKNQQALELGLADAMDLMVVCVEAGLTMDAAMQRVGEELALVHPAISREFGIAHMETRVGLARQEALKNLGQRTGNASLISLSAMLNQADRFGTSIAQALRIHAESLRLARHHRAEEMAAKSAVKLSFPLVLFIFPATFIVLLGPTVIELMNSPLMK